MRAFSIEDRRRAVANLFEYLDARDGEPLLAFERPYATIADAIRNYAIETGRPLRTQLVEELDESTLHELLTKSAKFVCAFNRKYRSGLAPHVRVMIERATTLARRAYTLSDLSDAFFHIFQVEPSQIIDLNQRVAAAIARGGQMRVTDQNGTDLQVSLSSRYELVHIDGFTDAALDLTVNLPPGEVATYSNDVSGVICFRGGLLGTIPIGRKHGFIDRPITFVLESNRVVSFETFDVELARDLGFCLDFTPFTRNVCEIGFGTHPAIRRLTGLNYTYEEKHYGFHIGLGASLAQQNVERATDHHLDLLFADAVVEVNGRVLFDGEYRV